MNEYTHLEITKKVNDLIDNLDQDEFNSYDELTEYIYESFKSFELDVSRDIIYDIIINKCKPIIIVDEVESDELYEKILDKKMHYIKTVPQPEQRTKAWFDMRNNMITASSGAAAIGENPYEKPEVFIMEKVFGREFVDNDFVHHGKKYEEIATKFYEHYKNTKVDEYGLIQHPKYSFFGASPDGICDKYTLDGKKNLANYGRMIEIKCPYKRKVLFKGEIDGEICPHYYWIQIQLQLECCDLEYCDFWQCEIVEYTDPEEWKKPVPMVHKHEQDQVSDIKDEWTYGFVLQYSMDSYKKRADFDKKVFTSKYIYPNNLLGDYDANIELANKMKEQTIPGYTFDKILYWRIVNSHCCEVKRDRKWFAEKFPIYEEVWNKIKFYRSDLEMANVFRDKILAKKEENKERRNRYKDNTPKTDEELAVLNEHLGGEPAPKTPKSTTLLKKSSSASWF